MARDIKIEKDSSALGSSSGLTLVQRLQEGSSDAWREMVELYGPLVDGWCRKSNVPTHAIPDIAQEVFLTAFQSLARFDPEQENATFRGWLWTVTRTRIVDFFRQQPTRQRAFGGSTALGNMQAVADTVPTDEPTEVDQSSALLHRALDQIRVDFTEASFELFWRAAVLGHPTDLIAKENCITPAAVRQVKSRVLRRLRKQLGDWQDGQYESYGAK